jgi:hypothetical protein
VTKTVSGKVKDIHPGDSVVIRGTKKKNGTVAADAISLGGTGGLSIVGGGANGGATGFGGSSSSKGGG